MEEKEDTKNSFDKNKISNNCSININGASNNNIDNNTKKCIGEQNDRENNINGTGEHNDGANNSDNIEKTCVQNNISKFTHEQIAQDFLLTMKNKLEKHRRTSMGADKTKTAGDGTKANDEPDGNTEKDILENKKLAHQTAFKNVATILNAKKVFQQAESGAKNCQYYKLLSVDLDPDFLAPAYLAAQSTLQEVENENEERNSDESNVSNNTSKDNTDGKVEIIDSNEDLPELRQRRHQERRPTEGSEGSDRIYGDYRDGWSGSSSRSESGQGLLTRSCERRRSRSKWRKIFSLCSCCLPK